MGSLTALLGFTALIGAGPTQQTQKNDSRGCCLV